MDLNCKLFKAKLEVTRIGVEWEDQGRASKDIGLGWSDQSKENQRISEWVAKRKSIRLYQIGNREGAGAGAGADPEEVEEA